ncbi:MAG: RNA-binding protein [Clostridium sp.]|nr:RNA-binding protein [Clostridium sp.]
MDIGVGQVVYSIAGRDADRKFIVVEIIDDCRVKVSDGDLRRIEKAKLKKLKHLKVTKTFVLSLAEKIQKGAKVSNAEIRKALADIDNEKGNGS